MNNLPIGELFALSFLKGAAIFLLGAVIQGYLIFRYQAEINSKMLLAMLLTRAMSIFLSFFLWTECGIDMIGPVFMPAIISESILTPVTLRLFGYKLIY